MTVELLAAVLVLGVTPEVKRALDAYDAGEYTAACQQLSAARIAAATPPADQGLILRTLGACHHIQGALPAANEAFSAWIHLDPRAALDPVAYPPEMVEFFQDIKARAAPAAPTETPASAPAPQVAEVDSSAEPGVTTTNDSKSKLVAVAPFGLGQFQNGDDTKGWVLLGLDAGALLFACGHLYRTESLKTSGSFLGGGKYATDDDRAVAEQSQSLYLAGFAIFGGLWVYGAIDGLVNFDTPSESAPVSLVPWPGGLGITGVFP